ncbi:MAG: DUF3868 domain-containing protein [Tannerellaceae bacterium]|nr:DUF3868 domain-containing protein [Tannerellaceae bacterium]
MKNKPFKTLLIFICITGYTHINAQPASQLPQVDGKVIYQNLQLEKQDNNMLLSFDTKITGKALNNRQSWTIIPELISTGPRQTSLFFPSLLINGRQKERHYRRKMNFRNKELLANQPLICTHVPQDEEQLIRYSVTIPYESWMGNSSLIFHQILTSPREKKQLFTTAPLAQLTPVPEPVAPPAIPVQPSTIETLTISGEAYIQFPVGESLVYADYMDNINELKKIGEELRKIDREKDATLIRIQLTGYASPEGPFSLNDKLSHERTKRLKDYLVEWHGLPPRHHPHQPCSRRLGTPGRTGGREQPQQ